MADTVYKLTHTGEQIDSAIDNAVRSDAQILTSEQQTQARTNISAASTANFNTESGRAKAAEQAISDNVGTVANLTTTAKTVVPAINELNQNLAEKIVVETINVPSRTYSTGVTSFAVSGLPITKSGYVKIADSFEAGQNYLICALSAPIGGAVYLTVENNYTSPLATTVKITELFLKS